MNNFMVTKLNLMVLAFIWGSLTFAPLALAGPSPEQKCEAQIYKIIGGYIDCISKAASGLAKNEKTDKFDQKVAKCDDKYEQRYDNALAKWPGACPTLGGSQEAAQGRVRASVDDFTGEVAGLLSGTTPPAQAGKVIVYNNCTVPVKLMSTSTPAINGHVVNSKTPYTLDIMTGFNQNSKNTIHAAPTTSTAQCTALACQNWTAIQPNTVQREGSMYEGANATFAAYCQATNAGAAQCTTNSDTPCCGLKMTFDGSFGTLWEITPFGNGGKQDTIDLSTNYGTGPSSPPPLCPGGGSGPNCVSVTANIFYNIPIEIEMSGEACTCGTLDSQNSIKCTEISCTDAFQSPTDNKNCECSSGGDRGYVITYCPAGSSLPPIATL